jgi:hypothetical protein
LRRQVEISWGQLRRVFSEQWVPVPETGLGLSVPELGLGLSVPELGLGLSVPELGLELMRLGLELVRALGQLVPR